jgi:TRAP-type mannitol/chloroaromatic compound transport system substrate-binding protein
MKRREFLKAAGLGLAGTTALAAPAVAQSMPEIRWRCTSSYPKSLDTIYGAGEVFAKAVSEMTDGKFQVQLFAAGEIVPGLQAADAVQNGTVECCHTASYYYVGKDPAWAFGTAVPYGLNARQQQAWMYQGGGLDVMNDFYKQYNIYALPAGNTGAQMGGWFCREIRSTAELSGLKMRIGGFAGNVLSKLGVVPQQLAGGDIYPALERGTIDAAEWSGPYDDEKLGFHQVAKYYYYPGWWEGGPMLHLMINIDKWNELPAAYQTVVRSAAAYADIYMVARYDALNPAALRRLAAAGAQLRPFPRDVLEVTYRAAFELYDDASRKSPAFKKIYDSWKPFREEQYLWSRFAENTFDNFVYSMQGKG